MALLDPVKNFAKVTVSLGYGAADTSVILTTGDGAKLPQPSTDGAFNLVWYNATDYTDPSDDPSVEIVRVTARSTDTLTITRAQESTSASAKNTALKTYKMILAPTKKLIDDMSLARMKTDDLSSQCGNGNKVFTLTSAYKSGTLFLMGTQFPQIYKPITDFTESGASQITLTSAVDAPEFGATLLLHYEKA